MGIYKAIHSNLVYPLWSMKIGSYPLKYLKEFEKSQYLTTKQLENLQFERLKNLLDHAYQHCPYYRESWQQAGISPKQVCSFNDFRKLPFITKSDIQNHKERMRRQDVPVEELLKHKTGGSTAEPLRFYLDKERTKSRTASTIRHDRWAGKDIGTYFATIWGHPRDIASRGKKWLDAFKEEWLYRRVILDSSSLTSDKMYQFVEIFRKQKPEVLVGYTSAIFLFTEFLRKNSINDFPKPRSVITSAESLEEVQREVIEEVFECPVFDRYGCREVSIVASECDQHSGMHVNAECLFVEVLKDDQPAAPGEMGEAVITDLLNFGMPMIRYKIKDMISSVAGKCACGRNLPRIEMRGGRVFDFIVTPEGNIVSPAMLTIYLITNTPGVYQGQLIQEDKAHLTIRIVKGPGFSDKSIQSMLKVSRDFLGPTIIIDFEYVDEIPLAPSGKSLFCISKVSPF